MEDVMIMYTSDLSLVDWRMLKARLVDDNFDNGRTPEQLQRCFENSFASCFALYEQQVIGKVRALSDGVCNAYIVDVWSYSPFRRQGIARRMMEQVLQRLPRQHVYLFTDDAQEFYRKLGFQEQGIGMSLVVGKWLRTNL